MALAVNLRDRLNNLDGDNKRTVREETWIYMYWVSDHSSN